MKRNKGKRKEFIYTIITAVTLVVILSFMNVMNNPAGDLNTTQEESITKTETTHVNDSQSTDKEETRVEEEAEQQTESQIKDDTEIEENKQNTRQEDEKETENKDDIALNEAKKTPKEVESLTSNQDESDNPSLKQTEPQKTDKSLKSKKQTTPANDSKPNPEPEQKPAPETKPKQEPVQKVEAKQETNPKNNSKPTPEPKQTSKVTPSTTTKATGKGSSSQNAKELQAEVLRLVNIEREKAGLNKLSANSALDSAAMKRAEELKQSFSHTRPDGSDFSDILIQLNITYYTAGENIAMGYPSPQAVVDGWMNSPGHKANILNESFTKLGVGVAGTDSASYQWVQIFVGN